ncbi:MAG: 23S rRNA (pseudouridine(1915)-N(3))-methyltransferase RlmH [Arenicellales bacterium]
MLNIHMVVIGDKMPAWVDQGVVEYQKRIRGRMALNLLQVAALKRGKNADIERIVAEEDRKLIAAIPPGCRTIALDRSGKSISTPGMVERFVQWLQDGEQIAMLVGGPEGLSSALIAEADETWSLSALTFAHPVVRVVLAEQVYRCYSVLEGLPYHR